MLINWQYFFFVFKGADYVLMFTSAIHTRIILVTLLLSIVIIVLPETVSDLDFMKEIQLEKVDPGHWANIGGYTWAIGPTLVLHEQFAQHWFYMSHWPNIGPTWAFGLTLVLHEPLAQHWSYISQHSESRTYINQIYDSDMTQSRFITKSDRHHCH